MKLCHWNDLPDGESRGFDPAGRGQDTVLIVRQGERLYAYADLCPHLDTPMAWRKDKYLNAAGDRIVCAAHGALFDITTGLCTLGPCLGDALTPVPLTVQANGEIHIAHTNHKETNP